MVKITELLNIILFSLISIVFVLFPFYAPLYDSSIKLLYIGHLLYMIGLYLYLTNYPVDLGSYAKVYLLNADSNRRKKYVIKTVYSYFINVNLYVVLLTILTWTVVRGDFRVEIFNLLYTPQHKSFLVSGITQYVFMNLLYTSIFALLLVFTNRIYAVLLTFILEIYGLMTDNYLLSPIIIYPQISFSTILVSIIISLCVITIIHMRWDKWILKRI